MLTKEESFVFTKNQKSQDEDSFREEFKIEQLFDVVNEYLEGYRIYTEQEWNEQDNFIRDVWSFCHK